MSKTVIDRQKSLECTPVRRRSGTSPEGEQMCIIIILCVYCSLQGTCRGVMCHCVFVSLFLHMS